MDFIDLLVTRTGFEPVNAAVKGRCVKPLHQRATCGLSLLRVRA